MNQLIARGGQAIHGGQELFHALGMANQPLVLAAGVDVDGVIVHHVLLDRPPMGGVDQPHHEAMGRNPTGAHLARLTQTPLEAIGLDLVQKVAQGKIMSGPMNHGQMKMQAEDAETAVRDHGGEEGVQFELQFLALSHGEGRRT